MPRPTRREFSQWGLAGSALTALGAGRMLGALGRLRLGFIGCGNRGDQVLDAFLTHKDCSVVALCDLHAPYLDFAARKAGTQPFTCQDYRRVLERKDVDAVVIATPDHWHCLQMIEACQAEKDVYVEKPFSLCQAEGRKMVEAAQRHQRVVQVGIHRRSSKICAEAAEIVRRGDLGKITVVRAFHIQNEWPQGIGHPADGDPNGFDWNTYLGPAPLKPFNPNRTFYRFRWFYEYSGGQLTNFGVHYIDMIHWALGCNAPLAVTALGGKYAVQDNREIPDTLEVLWQYPDNVLVTFSQFNANGAAATAKPCEIEFRGTKGTLYLQSNGYEIVPEAVKLHEFPALTPLDRDNSRKYRRETKTHLAAHQGKGDADTRHHARNFLDCVATRQKCNCDPETGHRSTSATQIANIAHQMQAHLQWDAKQERFTNNEAANARLRYEYRAPYVFPK